MLSVVNLLCFCLFLLVVILGVVIYANSKKHYVSVVKVNDKEVSTLKTLDVYTQDLLELAHRRASAEEISDLGSKVVEIRKIDSDLIRISNMIKCDRDSRNAV